MSGCCLISWSSSSSVLWLFFSPHNVRNKSSRYLISSNWLEPAASIYASSIMLCILDRSLLCFGSTSLSAFMFIVKSV